MKLTAMSGEILLCAVFAATTPPLVAFVVVIVWVCAPVVTVDVRVGRTALKVTLAIACVLEVCAPLEPVFEELWLFVVVAGVV